MYDNPDHLKVIVMMLPASLTSNSEYVGAVNYDAKRLQAKKNSQAKERLY